MGIEPDILGILMPYYQTNVPFTHHAKKYNEKAAAFLEPFVQQTFYIDSKLPLENIFYTLDVDALHNWPV